MGNRVQLLERSVAERIAAGEVVERPASVIKELVENSLDAGATRITVELQAGGLTRLRVVDDGHGMSPEDVRLAIERFATSKIRQWEDLDTLASLGFRGEALPSIAAVARLEILTCEPDATAGTELIVQGSEVQRCGPAPGIPGTRITVSELFFNTPARRKFLKSPAAETSQVVDLLGRLALVSPGVQFQVTSNGREALLMTGQMDTRQRLARLWKLPADELVEVNGETSGLAVTGWVALPQHARSNRTAQTFAVNGRVIKSQTLSQALLEGFSPLLPRGRYPVALLEIRLDPSQIDVNVHPTKAEVRFTDQRLPFRAVFRAVGQALERAGADTVRDQDWEAAGLDLPATPPDGWTEAPAATERHLELTFPGRPQTEGPHPPRAEEKRIPQDLPSGGFASRPASNPSPLRPPSWSPPPSPAATPSTAAVLEALRPLQAGASVKILAQLHRTYIVAEVEGELWLVDQHTAHERIWYERLDRLNPLKGCGQGLLVPEVLELAPAAAAFLDGHLAELEDLGFEVEPFGGTAFQLRSLPMGLKPGQASRVLREVVEEAASGHFSVAGDARERIRERLRAMVSCKSAVKAGDLLQPAEMHALLDEMLKVEHSLYCPHGRPTRVKLDQRALERLFHRG